MLVPTRERGHARLDAVHQQPPEPAFWLVPQTRSVRRDVPTGDRGNEDKHNHVYSAR